MDLAWFDFSPSGEENQIPERDRDIRVFELRPESFSRHLFSNTPGEFHSSMSPFLIIHGGDYRRFAADLLVTGGRCSIFPIHLELRKALHILIGISVR